MLLFPPRWETAKTGEDAEKKELEPVTVPKAQNTQNTKKEYAGLKFL